MQGPAVPAAAGARRGSGEGWGREEGPVGHPQSMPGAAKSPVRSQSPRCADARLLLRDGSKIV